MNDSQNTSLVRDLPRGEFVKRKPDARTVYIRGEYDRSSQTYSLTDAEDANREIFVKGTLPVYVGFTY